MDTKDHTILFSSEMVRALLGNRKTQTRGIIKPQPPSGVGHIFCNDKYYPTITDKHGEQSPGEQCFGVYDDEGLWGVKCPYGKVGDRLWVRETTWYDIREPQNLVIYACDTSLHKYKIRGIVEKCDPGITTDYLKNHEFWKLRPSIFMPRWASRITLEIIDIRVERVQDISEEDAIAEGCIKTLSQGGNPIFSARCQYEALWDSINAKRGHSWESNPYVWIVEFKRI